jgi:hypothetical protein
MKLKALDQIHVSSVQADSLRPGQEFEVSDALAGDLIAKNPRSFAVADTTNSSKAEPAPSNKAEVAAPANKAGAGRKVKAK